MNINIKTTPKNLLIKAVLGLMLVTAFCANMSHAQTTGIVVDVGHITSGGSNINGYLFLVGHGTNAISGTSYDAPTFGASTTSILGGNDRLISSIPIVNGIAATRITPSPSLTGVAVGTPFTGLFIAGVDVASYININTGNLLSGFTFGTGGGAVNFQFGTYRTDTPETFDGSATDAIGWVFSAVGNDFSLSAYTASYATANGGVALDVPATLATTGSFSIIPEPSTGTLMIIGTVGLVALRRLRKV